MCCENIRKFNLELYEIADAFNIQVQEMESQLKLRDKKIQKLKRSCQIAKEKERAGDESSSDSSSDSSDGTPSRGDVVASILQKEVREAAVSSKVGHCQ